MAITLADLRLQAQQRADMENSNYVGVTEWNVYINESYSKLYDILVSAYEDYYTKDPVSFTIASGNTYTLASDFYKLRGLDRSVDGADGWQTVHPLGSFIERNRRNILMRSFVGWIDINYKVVGNKLYMYPEDRATGNYRYWYIPRYTPLASDSSTLGDVLDFQEFIIVDAAIKALNKEETDASHLIRQLDELRERIINMSKNRDVGSGERVGDVSQLNRNGSYFPYTW
jgi:hypothetical protein